MQPGGCMKKAKHVFMQPGGCMKMYFTQSLGNWGLKQFQFSALNRSHMRDLAAKTGPFCVKFRRASFLEKSQNIEKIIFPIFPGYGKIGKIKFPIFPGYEEVEKLRFPISLGL